MRRVPLRLTEVFAGWLSCLWMVVATISASPTIVCAQSQAPAAETDFDREFEQLEREADLFQTRARLVKTVVRLCQPSVVHIKAIKGDVDSGRRARTIEEAGAGVILMHRGVHYVITNRHVVKFAALDHIHLYTHDGVHVNPTTMWEDADTDLAVLRLPEGSFVAARFEEQEAPEVGDFVVAIGSPFGLNHSVTCGIVSALGRRDLQLGEDGVRFQDFIQTDAAINPGNSGGPLINLYGRVVGINTAIASNSGGNDGIGFSIPMGMALRVVRDLIDQGKVSRGVLGVSLDSSFTPDRARRLGLGSYFGARISNVEPESAAARAGLTVGDVVLRFDGTLIENDSHLVTEISRAPLQEPIGLVVFREGREVQLQVTLFDRESVALSQARVSP